MNDLFPGEYTAHWCEPGPSVTYTINAGTITATKILVGSLISPQDVRTYDEAREDFPL